MPRLPWPLRGGSRRADAGITPSRFRPRDLTSEALAGLLQRPARTMLTLLGTVLGVGAFTAVLGLTATTSGQISADFTVQAATQVTVKDVGDPAMADVQSHFDDFPADADARISALNGVVHAGQRWPVFSDPAEVSAMSGPAGTDRSLPLKLYAASPGYLQAIDPVLASGTLFDRFHDQRRMRVAILGAAAAAQLGITSVQAQPAVFVNGTGYTVIGILAQTGRDPDNLLGMLIPDRTALRDYGPPRADDPATMLVETRLGAAQLIARQAPVALRPDHAAVLQAVPPPDPHALRDQVAGNLKSLFLMLAVITLFIGAVGIANTTLVAVMERIGEIGLRRALGARPRHVAGQFLAETAVLGTVGGLVGTTCGIGVVLGVSLSQHWTAVLDPATTVPAPLIGTLTGLVAGLYPAWRAARIEPLAALRR